MLSTRVIACLDVHNGRTVKGINFINLKVKSKSFHEHNENKVSLEIIQNLKNGNIVSIVSDAGTPVVSDPGYKLIQIC